MGYHTIPTFRDYWVTDEELNVAVGRKIVRALAMILAFFLLFDCQFLVSDACYKQYKV